MIIKRPNRLSKKIIIPTGIVILTLIAGGIYWYTQSLNKTMTSDTAINNDKPTKEQVTAGKNTKDTTVKGGSGDTGNLETGETQAPSSDAIPQISITAANQNSGVLQIRTLIPAVTTMGTCTLTLTNGTQTVSRTADVQALADNATCKGFDISTSDLPTKGVWAATVTYATTGGSTKATQNVMVN